MASSATMSNVDDVEVSERERLLKLFPRENEYEKRKENIVLFEPDRNKYGHVLEHTKIPAFSQVNDDDDDDDDADDNKPPFGGVPALAGRKYKDFRGKYMGLAPKGQSSGPLPFPVEEDVVKNPHFFYVTYIDGGFYAKELAAIREDLEKGRDTEWLSIDLPSLRDPAGHGLTTGSKLNILPIIGFSFHFSKLGTKK